MLRKMLTALLLSKVSLEAFRVTCDQAHCPPECNFQRETKVEPDLRFLFERDIREVEKTFSRRYEFPHHCFHTLVSNIRIRPIRNEALQNPNVRDSSVRSVNILTLYI